MENKIAQNIFWVGVHFSDPAPGVSVNCFLIKDETTVLIDTGAPATAQHVIANIKALTDMKKIDYVVITHADVDHIGGLTAVLEEAPQAVVIASAYEARGLGYWGLQPKMKLVEDGERLSLGRGQLKFVAAPFSCMPGTMMVFEETEGVLFSADLYAALGPQEWKIFADTDQSEMLKGVQYVKLGNTYHTRKSLETAATLPVKIIASAHGSMINGDIPRYTQILLDEIK